MYVAEARRHDNEKSKRGQNDASYNSDILIGATDGRVEDSGASEAETAGAHARGAGTNAARREATGDLDQAGPRRRQATQEQDQAHDRLARRVRVAPERA